MYQQNKGTQPQKQNIMRHTDFNQKTEMELESITIEYLQEKYKEDKTNLRFELWALYYIQDEFGVDSQTARFVIHSLTM